MNQRKTIPAAGLRAGPQERTFLMDATATLGPALSMGRPATGMTHMGSTLYPPCTGSHSAFRLPSPAHHVPAAAHHIPTSAHHIPTSAHHVSNENGQDSQTTTQTQSYTGQNDVVPSVRSRCFISGSIFSLLLRGGKGRGGYHRAAGLAGGCRYFSRSGSSSQLPR